MLLSAAALPSSFFLFSLPFRILFGGPAFLFGGPAVLFGGSAVLSGGPAILSGDPAVLFGGPAILSGGPAVLLRGPCTLVQFWGVKNGALNSSKSDFTIKALSSRRRHLLLSQGTSSAAQHRTGKHVILDTCGPKKTILVKFSPKMNQQNPEFAAPFWVPFFGPEMSPAHFEKGSIFWPPKALSDECGFK